jgi:hypothetical protein
MKTGTTHQFVWELKVKTFARMTPKTERPK